MGMKERISAGFDLRLQPRRKLGERVAVVHKGQAQLLGAHHLIGKIVFRLGTIGAGARGKNRAPLSRQAGGILVHGAHDPIDVGIKGVDKLSGT